MRVAVEGDGRLGWLYVRWIHRFFFSFFLKDKKNKKNTCYGDHGSNSRRNMSPRQTCVFPEPVHFLILLMHEQRPSSPVGTNSSSLADDLAALRGAEASRGDRRLQHVRIVVVGGRPGCVQRGRRYGRRREHSHGEGFG